MRSNKTGDMMNGVRQPLLLPPPPLARSSRLPYIHSLAKSTDGIRCSVEGLLAAKKQSASGNDILFDKTYERLQRTRTLVPPLPRNYQPHRSGNLQHPLGLSKDPPLGHIQPLSLGSCEGYHLNLSFLFPSALVLNKRTTFPVDSCQISRPRVNHRTCNLLRIKDIQKGQGSYPDPMAGAPHPFLHRLSELSSLEAETARQEKLGKMSRNRKRES